MINHNFQTIFEFDEIEFDEKHWSKFVKKHLITLGSSSKKLNYG